MISLPEELGGYALKARFYPALIMMLPLTVFVVVSWNLEDPKGLWPIGLGLGLPFLASSIVRSRGKKLEHDLVETWGGFPTTQLLRHSDTRNQAVRQRRRGKIEALTNESLPSPKQERKDPRGSDDKYIAATRALIDRRHSEPDKNRILEAENVGYGFRRNLLALKKPALLIIGTCFVADAWLLLVQGVSWKAVLLPAAHLALLTSWVFLIRPSWVLEAANDYANALFGTLEGSEEKS
jgi:hypothetical protein